MSRFDEPSAAAQYKASETVQFANPPSVSSTATSRTGEGNAYGIRPGVLLSMFTSLSFFIYFDRGVFGATLDDMQKYLHLSNLTAGICSSAYLVAYCVSAPVFAQIAKYYQPLRLCVVGMLVWVAAVVLSGFAIDFWTLLGARALTGVGEASFLVMAAPFIDYFAPKKHRSTWLSIFYAAIPVGYAGGYAVGGEILQIDAFSPKWDWRTVYFFEALCVLPFLLCFTTLRGPKSMLDISDQSEEQMAASGFASAVRDIAQLLRNPLYVLVVLGYASQTFFVGAVALYGIKYFRHEYDMSKGTAGVVFGAITAFTGLVGSALGGIILDKTKPKGENIPTMANQYAAQRLVVICSAIAAPACVLGFVVDSLPLFLPLLVVGELSAFMMTGPINNSIIWAVPVYLQPTAVACSTLAIHLLGDALSPTVIGAISDKSSLRTAMVIAASSLVVSLLFFLVAMFRAARYRSRGASLLGEIN